MEYEETPPTPIPRPVAMVGAGEHIPLIDTGSDTWRAVSAWIAKHRTGALKKLAVTGVDIVETEHLRGQLDVLDRLERFAHERRVNPMRPV